MPNLFRREQFRPLQFCAECGELLHDEGHVDWQERRVCTYCARKLHVPIKGETSVYQRNLDIAIRELADYGFADLEDYLGKVARFNELYPE